MIYCSDVKLNFCCGVSEIGDFNRDSSYFGERLEEALKYSDETTTGLCLSTFTNDKLCKKAYKYIKENTHILYQSPVYKNKGTGNGVFLIVYRKEL